MASRAFIRRLKLACVSCSERAVASMRRIVDATGVRGRYERAPQDAWRALDACIQAIERTPTGSATHSEPFDDLTCPLLGPDALVVDWVRVGPVRVVLNPDPEDFELDQFDPSLCWVREFKAGFGAIELHAGAALELMHVELVQPCAPNLAGYRRV